MEVKFPNNTYTIEPFGMLLEYKQLTNSNVITLDKFEDIFKMIISKNINPDYSDEKEVEYTFQGLTYFGVDVSIFLKELKDHIYKTEYENAKKEIVMYFGSDKGDQYLKDNYLSLAIDIEQYYKDVATPNELSYINYFWKEFIINNIGEINFNCIQSAMNNKEFHIKHSKETYGFMLSKNPHLAEQFFEIHIEFVNWYVLSSNSNISEEFYEKYIHKVHWSGLMSNKNISEAFLEKYIERYDSYTISLLCRYETLIEKYIDKVDWFCISSNENLSEAFFEKYIHKVVWRKLSENKNISEAFFERHIKNVDWRYLSCNTNISEAFIEKYSLKLDWMEIACNDKISDEFIEKHVEQIILAATKDKNFRMFQMFSLNLSLNLYKIFEKIYNFRMTISLDKTTQYNIKYKTYYYFDSMWK